MHTPLHISLSFLVQCPVTQSSLFVFVCILIYFLFVDFGSYLYFIFMKLYKLV